MMDELREAHAVHTFVAVFKARNERSRKLLVRLGFQPVELTDIEGDEDAMERKG